MPLDLIAGSKTIIKVTISVLKSIDKIREVALINSESLSLYRTSLFFLKDLNSNIKVRFTNYLVLRPEK